MANVTDDQGSGRFFSYEEAQDRFMARLHALEPRCFADLCSPEGLGFAAAEQDVLVHGETVSDAWETTKALHEYISGWQQRWNLKASPAPVAEAPLRAREWLTAIRDKHVQVRHSGSGAYSWITAVADATLREYVICQKYGEPVPTSFMALARRDPATWEKELVFNGQPVTVDAKAHSLARYLVTDEGWPLLTWNPRPESRQNARARLHDLLEHAMDRIEAQIPFVTIQDKHLNWLVRFQVMRQSQNAIARAEGHVNYNRVNPGRVNPAINQAAALIGIEPRNGRLDAGRPPKDDLACEIKVRPTARTIRRIKKPVRQQ